MPDFSFFNEDADIERASGAYLPHWHQHGVIYFVTFRLADSLPQAKLKFWAVERAAWLKENPEPHTRDQKADYYTRFPQRLQQWLDAGYGSLLLADPNARELVANAMGYFNGDRYILDEFVVAANHVHVLVAPQGDNTLSQILHTWRSYTAKELLKLPVASRLSTAPTVWQKEPWDHIVRSQASLDKFRAYIREHAEWEDRVAAASRRSMQTTEASGGRSDKC